MKTLIPATAPVLVLIALGAGGCVDNEAFVREGRNASAVPLGTQKVVRVETRSADIEILPSPDDTVRVVSYRRVQAMSERSADAIDRQIRFTMERMGEELVLRVHEPERGRSRVNVKAGPWRMRRGIEIEITVAVPARARVFVETERGDLVARELSQSISARSATGDFDLTSLTGPVSVESTSGDVVMRRVHAPVTVRLTSGDLDAGEIVGSLTVRATSGDVEASGVTGPVRIETSTGEVSLDEARGTVFVWTSSGDVGVDATADSLVAQTASGDIEAKLHGPVAHAFVKSSSGSVTLELPPRTGGDLDINTASGAMSVTSAIEVTSMSRNRLTGLLGGKGAVEVRTSSGDITLAVSEANP